MLSFKSNKFLISNLQKYILIKKIKVLLVIKITKFISNRNYSINAEGFEITNNGDKINV